MFRRPELWGSRALFAELRCGPVSAWHTIVNGRLLVEDGSLTVPGVDEMLARHRAIAVDWANAAS